MPHYRIRVEGKVQGVFFRATTLREAAALGITGWVKNQADGSVLIAAQGSVEKLQDLLNWCKRGSEHARVSKVEFEELDSTDFSSFDIVR